MYESDSNRNRQDRVGIIAEVCAILARQGVNVLDISQTVMQDYFTMIMMVDASGCAMKFSELSELLSSEGEKTGLSVRYTAGGNFRGDAPHMINRNEILQTIEMIDQQHLDIRTITMGIPCWTARMRT
jgi:ACT domain-containing protein